MKERLRLGEKLTYANVMVTILAVIVLGGGVAYAASHLGKNSVGAKQLKKNAVTGAKVKNNSLTGSDINEATLGAVPSATNAQTLGGMSAGQLADAAKLRCPAETELVVGVCFESATHSPDDLLHAVMGCGDAGRRLPSEGELVAYHKHKFTSPPSFEWVGPMYFVGAERLGVIVAATKTGAEFASESYTTNHPYRCVTMPSN